MSTWRDRVPALSHESRPGGLTLGRWRGAPIRVFPIGIVLVALLLGRFRFSPGVWLAVPLLVLVHELGHAAMVAYYRKKLHSIEVSGFGGVCRWSGEATAMQRAMIAWGGVCGQAALYLATTLAVWALGAPGGAFGQQVVHTFTESNLWIGVLNLIPIPPLDGVEAWKLPALLQRRYRGYWRRQIAIAEAVEERRRPPPPPEPSLPPEFDDAEIPESLRKEVNTMLDQIVRDTVRQKE